MKSAPSHKLPFVLFHVKESLYAVSSEHVDEIVVLPKVAGVPDLPSEIRGVINLRGKVIQVIDLRVKLGLPSAKTELDALVQLLHDREQDHRNWLGELEACVREHRPFKMARDPHACKFGLWFDKFQTDDRLLAMALKKMDAPHQTIHATADAVLQMAERGDMQGATELLAERRNNELARLMKLFEEARRVLRENYRELAVVLSRGDKSFAISIDRVEAVERIPEESVEPMPATMAGHAREHHWRLGQRAGTRQTILLFHEDFLLHSGAAN
jgi:purine-binding chemotaxis protein CheW